MVAGLNLSARPHGCWGLVCVYLSRTRFRRGGRLEHRTGHRVVPELPVPLRLQVLRAEGPEQGRDSAAASTLAVGPGTRSTFFHFTPSTALSPDGNNAGLPPA